MRFVDFLMLDSFIIIGNSSGTFNTIKEDEESG